jgi:predicted lipoprotein with Yx(FWY)xxD motif
MRRLTPLLLAALVAAGCGGSSTPSGSATVRTLKVPGYGTVLATNSGRPLYLLSSDPPGKTGCTGTCTQEWTPLTESGDPTASTGAKSSLLSSLKRSDGGRQVLYNGHALYTYARAGASLTGGAGEKGDGGTWYLVDPTGKAITTTAVGGY